MRSNLVARLPAVPECDRRIDPVREPLHSETLLLTTLMLLAVPVVVSAGDNRIENNFIRSARGGDI